MEALGELVRWARRLPPLVADAALALIVLGAGTLDIIVYSPGGVPPGMRMGLPAFGILIASTALLALRRRFLGPAFIGVQCLAILAAFTQTFFMIGIAGFLVEILLVYTIACRVAPQGSVGAPLWLCVLDIFTSVRTLPMFAKVGVLIPRPWLVPIYADFPVIALFWFAGAVQWRRGELAQAVQRRLAEVTEERERLAWQAVARERRRIAGDLRDVVTASLRRMSEESRRAAATLAAAPALAIAGIERIEATGRQALVDMRRLLGLIRSPRGVEEDAAPMIEGSDLSAPGMGGIAGTVARWFFARSWAVDATLVAVLGALMALNFVNQPGWKPIEPLLGGLVVGVLLLRRKLPVPVLLANATLNLVWILYTGNGPVADACLLIAVYTVASSREGRFGLAAAGLGLIAYPPLLLNMSHCACFLYFLIEFVMMTAAGQAALVGRRLIGELSRQTETLRATRTERIRLAVHEEQSRVAREMHDVVAHALTLMVVQAGAARVSARLDSPQAISSLAAVDEFGAAAMDELGRIMQIPERQQDETSPESVQPEGQSIADLVARATAAGQIVDLVEEGDSTHGDGGLEVSLYRIVQEALTNARRHAPEARATVAVRRLADSVEVEVVDDGGGAARAVSAGSGQGLLGIRERAAVFGGMAEAGPLPGGGFRVFARLPRALVPA